MKTKVRINRADVMQLAWETFKAAQKRFGIKMDRFGIYLKSAWNKVRERVNFANSNFFSGMKVEIMRPTEKLGQWVSAGVIQY